jgi:hypothetical protein
MSMNLDEARPFGWREDGRFTISFFEAPAAAVCTEFCKRGRENDYVRESYRLSELGEGWRSFLGEYTAPTSRGILMPTFSPWCAFVNNDKIGGIPHSMLYSLAKRMRIRSVAFLVHDSDRARSLGIPHGVMFYYCDGTQGEVRERGVSVSYELNDCDDTPEAMEEGEGNVFDEGGWEHRESGEILPFEQTEAYQRPATKDRLTTEMLEQYAAALRIRLDGSLGFYRYEEALGIRWQLSPEAAREPVESVAQKLVNLFSSALPPGLKGKWLFFKGKQGGQEPCKGVRIFPSQRKEGS